MEESDGGRPPSSSSSGSWALGLLYIVAVASIWIAASYVVQSVVGAGVSPFLVTYICNSLFVVCIPLVEISRYIEHCAAKLAPLGGGDGEERANLLAGDGGCGLDAKGRWTRSRVARVSLLICPFWFLAQLTFNLSLKYTTVTSNTILSSASSLFTFLVALAFLGEKFTWVKLMSVFLCMGGSVVVSLADSAPEGEEISSSPLLGDILALVSAGLYAVYITLIRIKLPNKVDGRGHASMAQFLGFLGLFNFLIFLPVMLVLNFTGLEPLHMLNWKQFVLIVGKGLFDNVLSDYLWAEAVLLTTTTVATAGLTIQVPIAAIVDSLLGRAPPVLDYIGAAAIMVGFVGINVESDDCVIRARVSKVVGTTRGDGA